MISAKTILTAGNGIYESDITRADFSVTCTPLAIFLSSTDVAGAGMQEQAFYSLKDNSGFYYYTGARLNNATVTGDYFAIGKN